MAFVYFHGVTEIKAAAETGPNGNHWVELTIVEKEVNGETSTKFTLFSSEKDLCIRMADAINAAQVECASA
jgi:hypothetical protein